MSLKEDITATACTREPTVDVAPKMETHAADRQREIFPCCNLYVAKVMNLRNCVSGQDEPGQYPNFAEWCSERNSLLL